MNPPFRNRPLPPCCWYLDLTTVPRPGAAYFVEALQRLPAQSNRRPSLDEYDNLGAGWSSIRFWKITGGGG